MQGGGGGKCNIVVGKSTVCHLGWSGAASPWIFKGGEISTRGTLAPPL